MRFFFAADLHGDGSRYEKLFAAIERERPDALFLGGDLLFDVPALPTRVFLIPGNDDPRARAEAWSRLERDAIGPYRLYGYPYVPPTPFLLKDWERYDVSHYVPPGCVSPEEGVRTVTVSSSEPRYATIAADLAALAGSDDLSNALFLFHTPPYDTALDRAALDGQFVDYVPLDVHVGSIAVRRFIEERQPLVTMHGHVHESARLTGRWMDRIGRSVLLGAAHDGPELALIRFDPASPDLATRELL